MGQELRVGVVIPVFDGERFLAEAVESALGQSVAPADVVVVDDGSTDSTAVVARQFAGPVRYLRQAHRGAAAARNRGAKAVTGDVLAFLDADDRWTDDALGAGLDALTSAEDIDIVLGQVVEVQQAGWADRMQSGAPVPGSGVPGYVPGACLVRRAAWERVGPFDPGLRAGEFIDWYLRARALGAGIHLHAAVVLWRRLHDANHGIRERPAYTDFLLVVKREIDRRRAAGGPPPPAAG